MDISRRALGAALLLTGAAPGALAQPAPGPWKPPGNAAIAAMLAERLDKLRQGVGIVAGVIDADGPRVVGHGVAARTGAIPVDGDTVFEIGSMTKVFTALLLADMAQRGEVGLEDPVARLLPPDVRMPERGRPITLMDLATHSSGLPRLPTNLAPTDAGNPYADYDTAKLDAFLNGYALTRDVGASYEYSNLAVGLLGVVLARRAGTSYEDLLRRRILDPLGMTDTAIVLPPALKARLAAGHTATLQPAANWDLDALAGAGAMRSTANDMLTFLAAELGFRPSPLQAAMQAQLVPRRRGPVPIIDMALGWHVSKFQTGEVYWHNGGTGGYRTFFGFDPKTRIGAVVLTNAATPAGGDDIGFHLIAGRPLAQLKPLPPPRVAIVLPPGALADFVGTYQLGPLAVTVTQDEAQLFAQITAQPKAEIFPERPDAFFWKIVDAQITFQRGPAGEVTGAVLHQGGRDLPAPRLGR